MPSERVPNQQNQAASCAGRPRRGIQADLFPRPIGFPGFPLFPIFHYLAVDRAKPLAAARARLEILQSGECTRNTTHEGLAIASVVNSEESTLVVSAGSLIWDAVWLSYSRKGKRSGFPRPQARCIAMHNRILQDAFSLISDEFDKIATEDVEERAAFQELKHRLTILFSREPRILTEAARTCIERFVAAELDYSTPGSRGLGRMSDHVPRLAAKHRTVVSRMELGDLEKLHYAISRHIACGYLFAELLYELDREREGQIATETLFQMWVPSIFLPPFDLSSKDPLFLYLKNLCFAATGITIRDVLVSAGATWDSGSSIGSDQTILTAYFDAGIVLRILESRPLSATELADVCTAGCYSRDTHGVGTYSKGSAYDDKERTGCAGPAVVCILLLAWVWLVAM